jgi:hypothetical protein
MFGLIAPITVNTLALDTITVNFTVRSAAGSA